MAESVLPSPVTTPTTPVTAAVCPYLLASDGRWRASTPTRDHRCTVVTPPAILAADKQRRLCLTAEHLSCSTYLAALDPSVSGGTSAASHDHIGRAVTRTAPLVLDHGRPSMGLPALRAERGAGQGGLVALMAVAFAAIVVARLSGGGPNLTPAQVGAAASASPSAAATPAATAAATPASSDAPAPTLVPTEVEPTITPQVSPVASPSPSPSPSEGPQTYTVRSGDTLGGIAGEFGTTVKALMELNGIEDARRLRVGQVLQLP